MIRKLSAIVEFRNKNSPKEGPILKRLNVFCTRFQHMALNNDETQDRSRVQCIAIVKTLSILIIKNDYFTIAIV
jgi:hypothetical protein